jgi:hypothetical protein
MRTADAPRDRVGADVAVIRVPAVGAFGTAAAGGRAWPMIPPIARQGKPLAMVAGDAPAPQPARRIRSAMAHLPEPRPISLSPGAQIALAAISESWLRLSPIWPYSRAIVPSMRTIWVIFVLAVITVAGEIYADAVMTSSLVAPAASDPPTVAAGHAVKPG